MKVKPDVAKGMIKKKERGKKKNAKNVTDAYSYCCKKQQQQQQHLLDLKLHDSSDCWNRERWQREEEESGKTGRIGTQGGRDGVFVKGVWGSFKKYINIQQNESISTQYVCKIGHKTIENG